LTDFTTTSYFPIPNKGKLRKRLILPLILFTLTVLTTTFVGGLAYSVSLILILLCHEMGHYLTARYYNVPASLPYFIPSPLPPFGTFGAVIKMEGKIPNRKALFDIGIMGPALGLAVALPVAVVGISLSKVIQINDSASIGLQLGDSIIFSLIVKSIHGPLPEGTDILLHPIGFAGWSGLLITALNLLPLGQLDGGHIIYALFFKRSSFIYWSIFLSLIFFAIIVDYWGWLFFLTFIYLMTKLRHPPTMDDEKPIEMKRFVLGILAFIFLIISFPPVPFMTPE